MRGVASLADRRMVTHNSDLEPDNMAAEVNRTNTSEEDGFIFGCY